MTAPTYTLRSQQQQRNRRHDMTAPTYTRWEAIGLAVFAATVVGVGVAAKIHERPKIKVIRLDCPAIDSPVIFDLPSTVTTVAVGPLTIRNATGG